eukprot:m.515293 g.515293  ORF g.515293 m.515293 type:complete len:50 (-) comp116549_c0_seq1:57-206(-)
MACHVSIALLTLFLLLVLHAFGCVHAPWCEGHHQQYIPKYCLCCTPMLF